jgi:sugar lactone lactonase YvrE
MSSDIESGDIIMRNKMEARDKRAIAKIFFYCLLPVACWLLFFAAVSFAKEKVGVKAVAIITGDEIMGRFNQPSGLFFDEVKKRLYVADSGNGRLVSFDAEFKYLAELTNEDMKLPTTLVKNKEGQFFILDSGKAEMIFIDLEKKIVKSFPLTGVPSGKEQFAPGGIAIGKDNRLYMIDKLNRRMIVVEPTGAFVREIKVQEKGFFGFTDVKVDEKGDVYAIDAIAGIVYIFDDKGVIVSMFGKRENKKYDLRFPTSLAVAKNGLIYIADQHAGRILVFDKKGGFQYAISKPGAKEGELSSPSYIFIDNEGRIYVIDGNRVQIFQEERE